jgi:hypothetical protein
MPDAADGDGMAAALAEDRAETALRGLGYGCRAHPPFRSSVRAVDRRPYVDVPEPHAEFPAPRLCGILTGGAPGRRTGCRVPW